MALANIIKEVDPPVELTQAEYNALSTAQKNDGTVYYITDGNGAFQTAATTPAEDTSGGTSNVQDELQKKVEKANVVNNFTTTQEGYVADARALKTIADNYSLKTDLTDYIIIRQYQLKNLSINAQSGLWPTPPDITVTGYTPRAIGGYYASIPAAPLSLRIVKNSNIYQASISLRNFLNQTVTGDFQFFVLYTKKIT